MQFAAQWDQLRFENTMHFVCQSDLIVWLRSEERVFCKWCDCVRIWREM